MEIAIVIVNLILLFYFTRMAIHSRQVQVAGKLGPTWIITVFFVGIGIIRLFQNHSLFSIIQTVLIDVYKRQASLQGAGSDSDRRHRYPGHLSGISQHGISAAGRHGRRTDNLQADPRQRRRAWRLVRVLAFILLKFIRAGSS